MIRNFLSGIVFGGVVAGLGLGILSQVTPLPKDYGSAANNTMAPQAPVAAVPEAEPSADTFTEAPIEASTEAAPEAGSALTEPEAMAAAEPAAEPAPEPAATAGAKDDSAATPEGDAPGEAEAASLPQPDLDSAAPDSPDAPVAGMALPDVPVEGDSTPNAPALAQKPEVPAAEVPQLSAELPPSAPAEAEETLLQPLPEIAADQPVADMAMDADATLEPQDPPAAEAEGTGAKVPEAEVPGPEVATADAPPVDGPATKAEVSVMPVPEAPAPAAEAATAEPEMADSVAPVAEARPSAGLAPAPGLPKTVDGVTTGRLPSIGAAEAPAEAPEVAIDAPTDPRPMVKFARPFTDDSGKPLFSIVLMDTGAADLDRARLASLPFPVSFVIDPLDPTAAAAAEAYRAGGQEVVMLASGIPRGANPADLEQTFQSNEQILPESVAVMDIGAGGFQDNRLLASQVVPLVLAQGRGLLTFDRGLNAADQVARREGLPAAVIFRELDAADEAAPVIRRYLDRAAFKAAQDGRVVVLGTTRPETITALMEWTVEGRSSSVSLAPLTAALSKP